MASQIESHTGACAHTSASRRLSQLQQYLQPEDPVYQGGQGKRGVEEPETNQKTTMADKDPITCHVLNTYTGLPGAGISCSLTLTNYEGKPTSTSTSTTNKQPTFTAITDADGRVKNWSSEGDSISVSSVLAQLPDRPASNTARSTWSLRLSGVDEWYREQGVQDCFWPEVEVRFAVDGRDGGKGWRHYHVPVLLGPWNYSTYRGS
ncbi:putative hydroxyisourate hydrolase [Microsporum canis]